MTTWQDFWTFRIVDQDTGAAVPGVPVSVLESGGRAGGYWVSDGDGLVRIPKHDQPRLRLRVGLRNEEALEFDARSLPDDAIPLTAPRDLSLPATAAPSAPAAVAPSPSPAPAAQTQPGHLMRFARVGVFPQDRDLTVASAPDPTSMRYGVVLEIELVWQSLGAQAGATLYSISLGPGEEVKLAVSDGRWRKTPAARERSLQIVAKMVGARQLGDGTDAVPLDACIASDLPNIATREVVRRFGHALRRNLLDRSLGSDIDQVLDADAVSPAAERRVYAHIAAHLPYYSATIIAAGDPAERFFALAKLRDPQDRPLTDVIENVVVDRVGNYVAFPLRSAEFTTPEWRSALASSAAQLARASQAFGVTLPIPGVWLRSELFPADLATESNTGGEEVKPEAGSRERAERRKRR
ncbi:MAG: hypothetical protein DMD38_00170 [Gemmatimonadetes bacterium]|nr:MAG: hypothetical protein DMD38_00170 [Gemmatimonadota bacterium]